jgi:predicted ATPase
MSAGHGGQALLSHATAELVRADLPRAVTLRDLGEHRLKDLSEPQRLHDLVIDGLDCRFPPLKTLGHRPSNLPVAAHRLIGRERELAEITRGLGERETRLLTLTGPGGTGKTRLAIEAAAQLVETFDDGVFAVFLAAVRDPELVMTTIAQTLGLREQPGETIEATLSAYLESRTVLLVLDNLEQVVSAAPDVARILAAAPGASVLATSREPLNVSHERTYEVTPLPAPHEAEGMDAARALQHDAIVLFVERARATRADFSLTDENAGAVAAICSALEGLPLAIELAAARVRVFSPDAIRTRLDRSLALLTGGARDADERHQTLRATIAWSYDLLRDDEQRVFAGLAVFMDGCRPDAAAAVLDANDDALGDVFEGVASLVEKSLLRTRDDPDGEPRVWMLETVRQFAQDLLDDASSDRLHERHAEYYLALAQTAEGHLRGRDQAKWLEVVSRDLGNMRAALSWALADGASADRAALGLRLAGALGRFWYQRAQALEGSTWLERALALDPGDSPEAKANALHALGVLMDERGEGGRAVDLFDHSLALRRAEGDDRGVASSLTSLGVVTRNLGDSVRARRFLEESLELRRRLRDSAGVATTTCDLGIVAFDEGDLVTARALFEESLALDRELDDAGGAATNLNNLAHVALALDELDDASALLHEALTAFRELGDMDGVAEALEQVAAVLIRRGQHATAAGLAGAAAGLRTSLDIPLPTADQVPLERHLAPARAELGELEYAAAFAAGAATGIEAAVAQALEETRASKGAR